MLRYRIGEMGSIKVILQKINREIFQKPEELMENIAGVTGHLKKKVLQEGRRSGTGGSEPDSDKGREGIPDR